MNALRVFLFVFFFGCLSIARGQAQEIVVQDLRGDWMVREGAGFRKFDDDRVKAIYISLDASRFKGDYLQLRDDDPYGIFINQKLVAESNGGNLRLSVDSLSQVYGSQWSVGIFQPGGINSLQCRLESVATPGQFDQDPILREGNYFLDFSLTTTLIVAVYLVFLFGTHSRLALDYLNAAKLFTLQEREGNPLASRITSRVNLLFYLFCCVFCSLTLLVVFRLAKDLVPLAYYFPIRSTAEGFFQWVKLSFIIAAFLFLKLVIVFLFSRLFGLKETAAIQYFHFIRALFLAAGLITLISVINFIFDGSSGGLHFALLKVGAGVLILSAGMMFFKLLGLTRYHFFHLFSYLCASEIIPLVILLKVLLY